MSFPSDDAVEKAISLVDNYRVVDLDDPAPGISSFAVIGDTDVYRVNCHAEGFNCECRASSDHGWYEPRCTHILAAMIYVGDAKRPGSPRRLISPVRPYAAKADPKPQARIVDPHAGLEKLRREGRCRICGWHEAGLFGLSRHHLIKRSQGGDDVDDNIVPLCGHGTVGCHGQVEAYQGDARTRLRARLSALEIAYVIQKKGLAWLDQHYPPAGFSADL